MATVIHRIRNADRARHEKLEQLLSLQGTVLRNRKQVLRDSQPSGVMDVEERSLDAEEQGVGFSCRDKQDIAAVAAPSHATGSWIERIALTRFGSIRH